MVSAESSQRRRGPRKDLSDEQLNTRRNQLLQVLEGHWATIVLKLQKCEKPDDLISIFSPLLETYAREIVSVFCHPSDEVAPGAKVRKIRNGLRALVKPIYAADESKRRSSQQLQEINSALAKASKAGRRIVRRARKKRRKDAWKIEQQSRIVAGEERELRAQLQKLEASFARQEIFKFLKSKRYELDPLSLANAFANLPYSGWRQSTRRTAKFPNIANGLNYQIFKAIRYLADLAGKQSVNAVVSAFRASIPSLPSRHKSVRAELAKNWFFLERAIRQAFKTTSHPDEMHFAITELYFKYISSVTQVEAVIAEDQKIELSKKPKTPTIRRSGR